MAATAFAGRSGGKRILASDSGQEASCLRYGMQVYTTYALGTREFTNIYMETQLK